MKIKKLAKIFDQVESMWYIGKEWQVFRLNLTHQQFIDELADSGSVCLILRHRSF